jgi:endonuclease YncB( thermonuclease family)
MFRFILTLFGIRRRPKTWPRSVVQPVRRQEPANKTAYRTSFDRSYTPKPLAASGAAIREKIQSLPKFRTVYIIDGDTVIVSDGRTQIRVRLDSIDCPEDGQHWGDIAKYGLIKLIGRQHVHLELHGEDVYGRTLATIYVWHRQKNQWLNVNERMVILGHAWVMRQFYDHLPEDRREQLNRMEQWARSKKVGLWGTSNPMPPWHWRGGGE